jgi:hypothetical protein
MLILANICQDLWHMDLGGRLCGGGGGWCLGGLDLGGGGNVFYITNSQTFLSLGGTIFSNLLYQLLVGQLRTRVPVSYDLPRVPN